MSMKNTNKGKTRVWQCAFYERECDDLGKYCWCHNPDSGLRECDCENIFVRQKCQFFKKGNISNFLKMDKEDEKMVESYLKEIEDRKKRRRDTRTCVVEISKRKI